jgi:hypothetical protein
MERMFLPAKRAAKEKGEREKQNYLLGTEFSAKNNNLAGEVQYWFLGTLSVLYTWLRNLPSAQILGSGHRL